MKTKTKKKKIALSYTLGKILYFAYGSNMNQERLEERVGKVVRIGIHRMRDYILTFNCGMPERRFANIVMTCNFNHMVEGVVYELQPEQLKMLDNFEGFPLCYQKIVIPTLYGEVYTYICINPRYKPHDNVIPSGEYMHHILKGCAENGFENTIALINARKEAGKWF